MASSPWLVACLLTLPQLGGDGDGPNEAKLRQLSAIDRQLRNGSDPFNSERLVPYLRGQRAKLPPNAPVETSVEFDVAIADGLLREGKVDDAIAVLDRATEALRSSPSIGVEVVQMVRKRLALAHLRRAEQANCVCARSGESCVFPLRGAARHSDREGATQAAKILEGVLRDDPSDLPAVWLLNLAHMALGSYPEGVPLLYRIPPERIESELDIGRFEDVAPQLGVNRRSCAGGAAMDDFDGDGDLDLVTSSNETSTPMAYYRNEGDGSLVDVSARSGLDTQLGALNFVQGDVDGDGRLDLYVPRGAWLRRRTGEIPHSLLRQRPDGYFLDVTTASGVDLAAPSQVAAFADVDNDGDLDLFVGCESARTRAGWRYPSRLYRNDGHGRFEDVAKAAGVQNLAFCKGAAFGDYDADGLVDLYVSNMDGPNRLYHNEGDWTFVDRALDMGVAEPVESFATWWFDADNDGWLDLLVTNYSGRDRAKEVAAYYKNRATGTDSVRLYLNVGGEGFRDSTVEMGLNRPFFPMGANFGDFDNDGFPDMYFGTGDPDFASLWPNVALRNDAGRRFQDITTSAGLGHLQKGHGVAFGDFDQDGDQDILAQMGGAFRDDAFYDALYRNPGHGHRWLTVRLEGVTSNRFAVGARIRVRIEEEEGERDVYAWVDTGGSFGCNSLQAEIGLGGAKRIVALEVKWPATGAVEAFEDLPLDRTIAITEGEGTFTVVETRPIEF